jgi:hypothetical protein
MLCAVNSIRNEQEAMLRQIAFLCWYSNQWKMAAGITESDQEALTQLIQTTYYLKEGLQDLYGRTDNLLAANPGLLMAGKIKRKHLAIVNSLSGICRELVDLNSKMMQSNKEHISESINRLCLLVTRLNAQENEISSQG